jgi:hypothetical protein
MAKSSKTTSSKAPWDKPNPKAAKGRSRKLSPSQKAGAKRSAKKAGRPYPSLVDNMNAAKKSGSKKSATKKSATKKSSTKKSASRKSSGKKARKSSRK